MLSLYFSTQYVTEKKEEAQKKKIEINPTKARPQRAFENGTKKVVQTDIDRQTKKDDMYEIIRCGITN